MTAFRGDLDLRGGQAADEGEVVRTHETRLVRSSYDAAVPLSERRLRGSDYLECVTLLLQQARLASPIGGLWEAADLQWWWRADQHADPERQVFWFDGDRPVAAVVFTNQGERYECALLTADHNPAAMLPVLWPAAGRILDSLGDKPVEIIIRDDDTALIEAVTSSGFSLAAEAGVTMWMPAAGKPAISPIPPGFTLADRSGSLDRPHHLVQRNGDEIAERLAECTLYRPDLDLAVYDPAGEIAAYGLFWADPVTGVGLVEPMRTEDRYQGLGLARHVLTTGVNRLTSLGCQRLKVSYVVGNEAAERLYLGVGFRPASCDRTYQTG